MSESPLKPGDVVTIRSPLQRSLFAEIALRRWKIAEVGRLPARTPRLGAWVARLEGDTENTWYNQSQLEKVSLLDLMADAASAE